MSGFSAKAVTIDLLIRYGSQVLGALVILAVGVLLARWIGGLTARALERKALEPPARMLLVRVVKVIVLMFTLVVALDKFRFQIAPLVAGIGVAGLGVGIALQGVLSNRVAGLSIILTKPFKAGEVVKIVGVMARGDSAITIGIGPSVSVADEVPAPGEIYQAVLERFRAARIEVPFPQRKVRMLPAA